MSLRFIEPLMPTLVEKPPEGDGWIHEVKFDGYRSQMIIGDQGTRIFTRRGLDWTSKYRDLAEAAGAFDVESAIIDGEIIVLNEAGLSDFAALRKAITRRQHDLYFVAFDLLHLNGHDLRDMALEDRREILAEMIPDGGRIQFSEALPGSGAAVFHLVDQAGLEGMVSKRLARPGARLWPALAAMCFSGRSGPAKPAERVPAYQPTRQILYTVRDLIPHVARAVAG